LDWKHTPEYSAALLRKFQKGNAFKNELQRTVDPHVFQAAYWVFLHKRLQENLESELISACLSGNILAVERALKSGADVNYLNEDYGTPLIIALKKTNIELVCFLLGNSEVNVNQTDVIGQTPLIIVSKLVEKDEFQKNTNGVLSKLLLSHEKILVNEFDQAGTTALMYAAILGNLDLIIRLVDAGADINYKQFTGNTPLHFAVGANNKEMVLFLLEHGAKMKKNGNGKTPFDLATPQIKDVLLPEMGSLAAIGENVKKYIKTPKNT